MDPLSDVLRAVRLNGTYFYMVEGGEPWSIRALPSEALIPRVMPSAEHLIAYHVLVSGRCWAGLEDDTQVELQPGDAIVFPRGDSHVLSSIRRQHLPYPEDALPSRFPETVRLGTGATADSTFVCGFLGCDVRPYNPLLSALPKQLHISGLTASGGWLSEFPRQVIDETRSGRAGAATVLTRMAELMFIEVVRRHVESLSTSHTGWLAGLRDPVVAPALAELHGKPLHPWTLAELARAISSSRTVLAERFNAVVGIPPMQYLTQWRLQLAAEQLLQGAAKVSAIAAQVGYESEAAFSRAFKRATGQSPAAWRRTRQRAVTGADTVALGVQYTES